MALTPAEATARAQLQARLDHVAAQAAGDPSAHERWRQAYLTAASVTALAARLAALPSPTDSQAEAAALLDALVGILPSTTPPATPVAHVPTHTARVVLAVLAEGETD
jgi:hypothetical protein